MHLLRNCFDLLSSDQQKQLLSWIMKGHKKRKDESREKREFRKNYWIRDRLHMIREALSQDLVMLLESLNGQLGEPDHPDFLIYTTSGWGSPSPLTQTQVEEMSDSELIQFLKTFTSSGSSFSDPTPEGLTHTIESAVFNDPTRFAGLLPKLIDERIRAPYVYALFTGLRTAWKEGKDFDWEPVLIYCESLVAQPINTEEDSGQDSSEEDSIKWVYIPGEIADLLQEGLRRDEHTIPPDYLPRVREVIFKLVEDPHPTPEEEKDIFATGNTSAAMLSLNCNRGKAMHALIHYALRFVRVRETEQQGKKDPFPNGIRMDPKVQRILGDELKKANDPSVSVHAVFGWYLPKLFYLNRKWLEEMLQLIFPNNPQLIEYRRAAWDAYITFNRLFKDIYKLLRSEYQQAVIDIAQEIPPQHTTDRPEEKLGADSGEIGHVSAPNRPPCKKGSGSGAGMAIV